jgi:hypothetical protein
MHLLRIVMTLAVVFAWPAPTRAEWPEALTIGTASPGGTYDVYGAGVASILTRVLGIPVQARSTEGPNENMRLLEAGEIQLAFVTTGTALQAWNGNAAWTGGRRFQTMRAIFPMYDTPFQFMVLRDSGIRSVADLAGKRVGAGPRTGTAGTYMPTIFATLKVDAVLSYGDWADLASQVAAGTLDALAGAAGVPFPSFAELEAKNKVRYIPLAPEQMVALRLAIPELTPSTVPAGAYPSLLTNYQTVGLYNFAVAREDLPDDLVYRIVRAVFANREELIAVHPAAAATVPANLARNTFLPFHGGAIRYYREVGGAEVVQGD